MHELPPDLITALGDRYRPESEIGSGGMATVYRAFDHRHDRHVAVKVLRPDLAATLGAERFLQEIQIAARLNHPHILPLLDSGGAGRVLYYVMPFIEGQSLRHRLLADGRVDLGDTCNIIDKVADALTYAHRQGIVHRDIKPENLLFSEGHPVVADFGIAKAISEAGHPTLTRTGFPLGTPGYMSPEQAAGRTDLDPRTDVFSLACVAYEMLVGSVPGMWVTDDDLRLLRFGDAPDDQRQRLDRLPGAVEQVLVTAMTMRPEHRFDSPDRFATALADARTQPKAFATGAAHRILARAADLQAAAPTGAGHSLGGLERIAAEVDIQPALVRQAAQEAEPTATERRGPLGPSEIHIDRIVPGEIAPGAFEEVLEEIRASMGEVGRVNETLGNSLSWNSLSYQNTLEGSTRLVHIMVKPRDGVTRIRITESAGMHTAVGLATVGGVAVAMGAGLSVSVPLAFLGPLLPVVWAGGAVGLYSAARSAFQWWRRRRRRHLGGLADRIAEMARAGVARQIQPGNVVTPV